MNSGSIFCGSGVAASELLAEVPQALEHLFSDYAKDGKYVVTGATLSAYYRDALHFLQLNRDKMSDQNFEATIDHLQKLAAKFKLSTQL